VSICFEMLLRGSILMSDLIVMLVAVNELWPIGGEHVSRALMQLTGLQALNISSACLLC
jgi:hypothetical protein